MKRIGLSAITLVLVIGILGAGTLAYFTDDATTDNNTFTSGTLVLDDSGFSAFDLGSVGPMAPGQVSSEYEIAIKNDGTLPLVWFGDWVLSGGDKLPEALYIDSAKMEFLREDGSPWLNPDEFIKDGLPSGEWQSCHATLVDPELGVITLKNWVGASCMAPGTPYEHMGALNPTYSYKLTVRFGLAEEAGNEYQGKSTNIAFKVYATQFITEGEGADEVNKNALGALYNFEDVNTWVTTWVPNQLAEQD